MQKQIFAITIVTLFTSSALVLSATDTPETRRREAERYLQVSPPKALFEDMADKIAATLPANQREQFKKVMTTQVDIAALSKAMTDAMVKNFTTEELKALADFYGSPVGKSAMQNMQPNPPSGVFSSGPPRVGRKGELPGDSESIELPRRMKASLSNEPGEILRRGREANPGILSPSVFSAGLLVA